METCIGPDEGYRLIADWIRREESHLRSLYL